MFVKSGNQSLGKIDEEKLEIEDKNNTETMDPAIDSPIKEKGEDIGGELTISNCW